MIKHIAFPSIEQFKGIAHNVKSSSSYIGKDEQDKPIYDYLKPQPSLSFKGHVKIHGTNAGVCYNKKDGFWFQSRENIITPLKDNAGFAFFADEKKEVFLEYIDLITFNNNIIDLNENTISIYGEWAGGNIQKNVGVQNIQKSFFIFGVKITPDDTDKVAYWVDFPSIAIDNIYDIKQFGEYEIDIDFNNPEMSINKIIEMTIKVEEECPVAKYFGFSNTIGEGIVFSTEFQDSIIRFKSKGELHSKHSKVKTLNPVDENKIELVTRVCEEICPEWRLEQILNQTCDTLNGGVISRFKIAEFIKNTMTDIIKEESLTLQQNNFSPKDISGNIATMCKKYLIEHEG